MKITTEVTWSEYKKASWCLSCGRVKAGVVYPVLDQGPSGLSIRYASQNYLQGARLDLINPGRPTFDTCEGARSALEKEIANLLDP